MRLGQIRFFRHFWAYAFLIVLSIAVLFPVFITVSQSLMTNQEVNRWPPPLLTTRPTLENYVMVFTQQDLRLLIWLRNSLYAAAA